MPTPIPIDQTCGFVAACGRRTKHRGHHGGWRTSLVPDISRDVEWSKLADTLTPRQIEVVFEYLIHGGYKEAATCLGMTMQTAKNHGRNVLERTGAVSIIQLPYLFGWVTLPIGIAQTHTDRSEMAA